MNHKNITCALLAAIIFIFSSSAADAEAAVPGGLVYTSGSGAQVLRGPWKRYDGNLDEAGMAKAQPRDVELSLRRQAPDFRAAPALASTYRIVVRIAGNVASHRMALYVPGFAGIASASVNGELLYDSARDPDAAPLLSFDSLSGYASIVFKFSPGSPGLESPSFYPAIVIFGDAESVYRMRQELGAAAAFMDGFFIALGIFVFALFLFWKKNGEFLAFALFMLVVGLFFFLEEGTLFLYLPLAMTRQQLEVAHLIALDMHYLALGFLLHALYRDRIKGALSIPLYAIPAVLIAACLMLPSAVGEIYFASQAYISLFGLVALSLLAILVVKGDRKARWLIPAYLAVPAALAFTRFGPESAWSAYFVQPMGSAAFAALVLLMLIKKVAFSFKSTESLNVYVAAVTRAVRSFIPREFLENLDKTDLIDLRLGDHAKKEMTIFFSDIRGFTQLSEGLTVEENFAFINSYLARVVPIIKENGGFVDKYMGDGIMALFPGPKGPDEAIRSAIAMQAKIVEYNGHRAKMGYKPISMGVGIHTGDLMLGVVGVEDRMENTVVSDAVNLGSRLQAIAKAFNISLVISEQAFKELEDPGSYMYRFIGKVKVKGKAAPVSVFEIFDGIASDLHERKMKANMFFEQGMLSYYQKDFAGAMYNFKRVLEIIPEDGAAGFYLDNCMSKATL